MAYLMDMTAAYTEVTTTYFDTGDKVVAGIRKLNSSLPSSRPSSDEIEAANNLVDGPDLLNVADLVVSSPNVPPGLVFLLEDAIKSFRCYLIEQRKREAAQKVELESLHTKFDNIQKFIITRGFMSTEITEETPAESSMTAGHPSDIEKLNFKTLQSKFNEWFVESTEILSLQSRLTNDVDHLPPHFFLLAAFLKEVDLSHNKLQVLPEIVGCCFKLIRLNVEHNEIKFIPEEILRCEALKELNAGHNRLCDLPEMPGNVEIVLVPHNRMRRLPDSMGSLTKLRELDVSGNLLAEIPNDILGIKSMVKLNISINRHLKHLPNTIQRDTMLEEFDISRTILRSLPDTLGYATKLHTFRAELTPCLKHPPKDVVSKGPQEVVRYMERRHKKFKRRLNRGLKKTAKFIGRLVEKVGSKGNFPPIFGVGCCIIEYCCCT